MISVINEAEYTGWDSSCSWKWKSSKSKYQEAETSIPAMIPMLDRKRFPSSRNAPFTVNISDYHLLEFGVGGARTAIARQYMFKLAKLCFVYRAKLLKRVTRSRKCDWSGIIILTLFPVSVMKHRPKLWQPTNQQRSVYLGPLPPYQSP